MTNASAWNNGKPNANTGAGYGLRVDASFASTVFSSKWTNVELYFQGQNNPITVKISPSAQSGGCPELRSKGIGSWLIVNNNHQWNNNQPPRFTLIQRGNSNVFDVI
jgi:hypothetical protein